MKSFRVFVFCSLMVSNIASAGLYDQATAQGAKWLAAEQNRNKDGSWGESPDTQPIYTSAAILALDASYKRQNAYFAGLTWLENHASSNVDLLSRRVGALTSHGDTLSYVLSYLQNTQVHNGASYFGWGLSPGYTSSAIDTALALIAYADMKQNLTEQVEAALVFLKNNQRTEVNDKGWTISNANTSDPAVTALVIQALSRFATQDTSLNIVIENGLETLNSLVDVSAPPILQALAAQASQDAGNNTLATTFLDRLIASQSVDGSWNADPYATALATRAVATATYSSDQSTPVFIPDEALRRAVNLALGRNAMDNINRGELAQLTSLSAIGAGISDLTGLEWAINLTNANFNNNNLTNITALSGLLQLTSLSWTGNPGNSGGQTQIASSSKTRTQTSIKVPAVPLLGLILMGVTLLTITNYIRRTQSILRKSL